MKNLTTRKCARIAAAALAATVTFGAMAFALSYKPAADSYTIASDDGGYYSETTYYLTEEAFGVYESQRQAGKPAAKAMSASSKSTSESEQEDGEFVMGVAKSVWVAETTDEDGNVVESELLTKDEMDDYGISTMAVTRPWFDRVIVGGGGGGGGYSDEEIGESEDSLYLLDISLAVTYNKGTKQYSATGNATWAEQLVWIDETYKAAEESYLDFLAISWGGDGNLKAESHSITGKYYDGNAAVNFTQKMANPYEAFVWQFYEKEGFLGDELEYAKANVILGNTYEKQNKETYIAMTYTHNYGDLECEFSFGLDALVSFVEYERAWEISIYIPEIEY